MVVVVVVVVVFVFLTQNKFTLPTSLEKISFEKISLPPRSLNFLRKSFPISEARENNNNKSNTN